MMNKASSATDFVLTPPDGGVYFDNNATTRVADEVVARMVPLLTEGYGNPSSMHSFGARAAAVIATAREQVRSLLGARQASEIVFTGSGSEADNLAIVGTLRSYPQRKHLVTTAVEHPAVLGLCRELVRRQGYRVTLLGVDGEGRIDLAELRDAVTDDTALVSIMLANNETGVLFDVAAAGEIVKAKGAVFHVDAVQGVGKVPVDMSGSAIDLLSLSGHKFHAPMGVGVLYARRGVKLRPLVVGGHQERGRRAGTENVSAVAGLGVACDLAAADLDQMGVAVASLRDRLERGLLAAIPNSRVNGDRQRRLPNTTNMSFAGIEGEGALLLLDRSGVAVSSGSACTSGSLEPSHVLRAMGLSADDALGSVRFSLSRYSTLAEIDYVIKVMPPLVERLRQVTPFNEQRAQDS